MHRLALAYLLTWNEARRLPAALPAAGHDDKRFTIECDAASSDTDTRTATHDCLLSAVNLRRFHRATPISAVIELLK